MSKKTKMTLTQLDQLKKHTVVVADTGDIDSIKQFSPTDATTNPSLILTSATQPQYEHLLVDAIKFAQKEHTKFPIANYSDSPVTITTEQEIIDLALDKCCVNFGCEILNLIEGVVSSEVDARLSFDTAASVARGRRIIKLYEDKGVKKERVLIKLASTWEGFEAAKVLKAEGIKCNMTLLFSFAQAVIAAQIEVELISPFVGRILDWYCADSPDKAEGFKKDSKTDPGVVSVKRIYNYYKKHGYKTIVMGASFRNSGEILELAGCDKLTIGPKFLKEMGAKEEEVKAVLTEEKAKQDKADDVKISMDEKAFRWEMNQDTMSNDKLAEGIRKFAVDIVKLENIIKAKLT